MRTPRTIVLISVIAVALCVCIFAGILTGNSIAAGVNAPAVPGQTSDNVGDTSATINSLINPEDDATTFQIQYVSDALYTNSGWLVHQTSASQSVNGGIADSSYHVSTTALAGLNSDTLYHVRVAATNGQGSTTSPDSTFITGPSSSTGPDLPEVFTEDISAVGSTGADLSSWVGPNQSATTYQFLYATDAYYQTNGNNYDSATSVQSLASGASDGGIYEATDTLSGLEPGTTYHVQALACNTSGCTFSSDRVLTTAPVAPTLANVSATADGTTVSVNADIYTGGDTAFCVVSYVGNDAYEPSASNPYVNGATVPCAQDNFNSGSSAEPVVTQLTGLDPETMYDYQITVGNSVGNDSVASTVLTGAAAPIINGNVTLDSHILNASAAAFTFVYNSGGASISCSYDLVSDASYQPSAPDPYVDGVHGPVSCMNSGLNDQTGYAHVEDLSPLTAYHFRLNISNSQGQASSETTFSTLWNPPELSSLDDANVTDSSAQITVKVNPNGMDTRVYVDYGTGSEFGSDYGQSTETVTLPGAFAVYPLTFSLNSLAPDTNYSYRVRADNSAASIASYTSSLSSGISGTFKTKVSAGEPLVWISTGPKPESPQQTARFIFSSSDVAQLQCSVDGSVWADCLSDYSVRVLPGDHQLELQGTRDDGKVSAVSTYYWTVDAPKSCKVKTTRARAQVRSRQNRVYIVTRYTSWKPARNVVARFYSLVPHKRGRHTKVYREYLGKVRANFKKRGGVVRSPRKLNVKTAKRLRHHKDLRVSLRVPGTSSACTRYLSKNLDVPKTVHKQLVLFQTDSVFTPGWKGN